MVKSPRVSSKPSVPKMGDSEMKDRLLKYPITKSEIMNYLLRIKKTDEKLDPKQF